jgi:hypothetical protein
MPHDPQIILQIVTAVTAFAAVIIGPLLTRRQIASAEEIARLQIRASVVSTNRQDWINTLRDAIAEFLSKEAMARTFNRLHHADAESLGRIQEVLRLNCKITLLINSRESDHARLVKLIDKMTNSINGSNKTSDELRQIDASINDLRIETVTLSQAILKREWERVKSSE